MVPAGPYKIICSSNLFHGSYLKIEQKFVKFKGIETTSVMYEIRDPHSSEYKDYCILGCGAMLSGECL
jgi:hypothetical protein